MCVTFLQSNRMIWMIVENANENVVMILKYVFLPQIMSVYCVAAKRSLDAHFSICSVRSRTINDSQFHDVPNIYSKKDDALEFDHSFCFFFYVYCYCIKICIFISEHKSIFGMLILIF